MKVTAGRPDSPSRLVRGFRHLRTIRRLPLWARYLVTVGLVLLAALARDALGGQMRGFPFLLFFPAVILAGALFNRGAGVLAAVLSTGLSIWFIPPVETMAVESEYLLPLALFALIALICALSLEALQEAVAETVEREAQLNAFIQALEQSEQQKQMLLVELAHRIRNDLSALAGVLQLQSKADPEAAGPLQAAAARVRVLSRVHARFGQTDGRVVVDAREFLTELGRDLEITQLGGASVRLTVEAVSAPLPLETATALGLIVNELVTNAAKYAFPDGVGRVTVSFLRRGEVYVLTVRDDGVGPDERVRGSGLGTKIIRSLAAQLGGTFERRRGDPGCVAVLTLPPPALDDAGGPVELALT